MTPKTILVTGSGKGLGSAIALEAARQGYRVALHYRSSREEALASFHAVEETGCECILLQGDLGVARERDRMYAQLEERFGGVDILVNNAAMQYQLKFDGYTEAQMQRIFRVNLGGYLAMSQKVIPYMRSRQWGRIINISSVHAKRPTNFDPGYGLTKGAIKMLTRELALETAADHITVNAIELGYVDVGEKSGSPAEIYPENWEELAPPLFRMRKLPVWDRLITQEEVGQVCMFFASDAARSITGASLRLDDGATLL